MVGRRRQGSRLMDQGRAPHRIQDGAGFRDDGAQRGYWVRCSCGWESDLCPSPILAEAGGEQHVELRRHDRNRT